MMMSVNDDVDVFEKAKSKGMMRRRIMMRMF